MATYIGYSSIGQKSSSRILVDKELAKRDLMNHFYTRKGERVVNPEFGSIIWEMLFEPLDVYTETVIKEDVERIITSDPRWNLLSTRLQKPNEHTINVYAQVEYIDTGTAEELYLNFVGEIA
jgi:phage baseplate assembly protein W